jgi:type VI secretion system protein ImpG
MLPNSWRSLSGLRLIQEYFAFAQRFLFFDLTQLDTVLPGLSGRELEIHFLFSRPGQGIDGLVEPANFALHCVPAINLFPKRADRIPSTTATTSSTSCPNARRRWTTRCSTSVGGRLRRPGQERKFLPLFAPDHSRLAARRPTTASGASRD